MQQNIGWSVGIVMHWRMGFGGCASSAMSWSRDHGVLTIQPEWEGSTAALRSPWAHLGSEPIMNIFGCCLFDPDHQSPCCWNEMRGQHQPHCHSMVIHAKVLPGSILSIEDWITLCKWSWFTLVTGLHTHWQLWSKPDKVGASGCYVMKTTIT